MTDHHSHADDLGLFKYTALFISDLHLGSNKTATPYLYEFLKHVDFSTLEQLYLVGDVIGGWEHQAGKPQPFPEMERRVLDILNYAAASGVKVHLLPGNHDEKLRPVLADLRARADFSVFHENVIFENESFYETRGPDKKRLKIVHGDQHDPDLFVKPWFKPITHLTSSAYDLMVKLNYHASDFMYKHFGRHVSFAKNLKQAFKSTINFFFSHDALLKGLEDTDFDGVLMGHTHMPGVQKFEHKGRVSYLINDGDWVESATAAYVDNPKELPKVLNYKTLREEMGFGDLPDAGDAHPAHFAAFRAQTNRQVALVHTLWPARDRDRVLGEFNEAAKRIVQYRQSGATLRGALAEMNATGRLTEAARTHLGEALADTKSGSYKNQKTGLRDIFNRCAADTPLAEEDLMFAKTVLREFATRSDRKLRKHEGLLESAARRLDYIPSADAPRARI